MTIATPSSDAPRRRDLQDLADDFRRSLDQRQQRDCLISTADASRRQVGGTHYKTMRVQPWDVVDGWPVDERRGYYRGNALKYLMRAGAKDHPAQEIEKCIHYLEKLLEILRSHDDPQP